MLLFYLFFLFIQFIFILRGRSLDELGFENGFQTLISTPTCNDKKDDDENKWEDWIDLKSILIVLIKLNSITYINFFGSVVLI